MAKQRKATTVEGRESQIVSKAIALAEKQIDEGTASAGVLIHFLKLGTAMAQLEKQRAKNENELIAAKVKVLQNQANEDELYGQVIDALKRYGRGSDDEDEMLQ